MKEWIYAEIIKTFHSVKTMLYILNHASFTLFDLLGFARISRF